MASAFFFTGDNEPPVNIYRPEEPEHAEYQQLIEERSAHIVGFVRGVDCIVTDAQYTRDEYFASKVGWGHGYYESVISMAQQAEIPQVFITHHDPTRTDDQLDAIFHALDSQGALPREMQILPAAEQHTITL